ncbi:type VII secretion protein EccB [Nocardia cyriacigeorgica]|uniref:Type VII secretion protein EccB n=1 Tax=Nocardia cyriacigeorgica TaxID=135487 RepID=A0A6P1D6L5_9NOCA|nr:type VII secretion protein EccB [Nocardia cyriacigeorgica]NEW40668.1 type VII secretion protein EccB [Nocardia cyriacigeorgica]NEW45141.1 type VII secretion protein EccB [Nocardia cyriacigeorgica]NEW51104.1 type VII secretion protein EccB [Nocardia cyriacigeorgica]NEW54313.1 type VII secretion protein EccB [Nocardia cyriacigeorgica]
MARFRVVTKHQISGWRFLLHRIEHALVRRDASMIDDPQRGRSTALTIGVALACIGVVGAAVMAFFKPAKSVGDSKIVADKDTGALYVRIGDRLHPALNLTSARLVIGSAETPVRVSNGELSKFPRGPWVGIPGAPGNIIDSGEKDSSWTVCDTTHTGAASPVNPKTGLPTVTLSAPRTTAIGGPLEVDGQSTRSLTGAEARLLRDESTTWLIYSDPEQGYVRAAIDLADSAVVLALGIDPTATVVAASKGLIDAIPEVPPLRVPQIPGAGDMATLSTGLTVPVGSVLTASAAEEEGATYVVSQSGVVRVSEVLAAMIRNADSQGAISRRTVGPDVIAANLRPGAWPGTATYPAGPVQIVEPERFGVTCYHWSKADGDTAASTELLAGDRLPLTTEEQRRTVSLVTAQTSQGSTADSAYLPRTTGRFVQITGSDRTSPLRESLFWISDSGVRYGIDVGEAGSPDARQVLAALALRSPVPAPWSIVSLFAVGPTLSQADARIVHDGIPADKTGVGFGAPS